MATTMTKDARPSLPADYAERVYAGVLGKLIGVYLGRPFEGWTYDRITAELGEVDHYVHESRGMPLVVTDDDISGTFTFLRALPDHGNDPDLTPEQIGNTWLNYIIERRTILWWGGIGNSTEHTAYLRLKSGIPAPASGSIALNGKMVAEQIGAQIFIDGWGMIAPGDPELRRRPRPPRRQRQPRRRGDLRRAGDRGDGGAGVRRVRPQPAASTSAVSLIPADSTIARLIADIREWHAAEPDWRKTREQIAANYGYDKYIGNCHMVPNHALIILALLYGDDDFRKSLMIVNTAGWDTDCNSGNVGACSASRTGWRASTTRRTTGAVPSPTACTWPPPTAGEPSPTRCARPTRSSTSAARWPASRRWRRRTAPASTSSCPVRCRASRATIRRSPSTTSPSRVKPATRTLAVRWDDERPDSPGRRHHADVHPAGSDRDAGATRSWHRRRSIPVRRFARVSSAHPGNAGPVEARLLIRFYGERDELQTLAGSPEALSPGRDAVLAWRIPELGGAPVAEVGIAVEPAEAGAGAVYLDWLTWDGAPDVDVPPAGRHGRDVAAGLGRRRRPVRRTLAGALPHLAEPRHRADQPGHRGLDRLPGHG